MRAVTGRTMRAAGLEPVRTMSPDTGRDADTAGDARGRARTGPDDVAGHGQGCRHRRRCARPGSNRRPPPCKGDALPLSYARAATLAAKRAGPAAGDDGGHGADRQGRRGHRRGVGHRAGAGLAPGRGGRARGGRRRPQRSGRAGRGDRDRRARARRGLRRRRRGAGHRPRRARAGGLRAGGPVLRQRRRCGRDRRRDPRGGLGPRARRQRPRARARRQGAAARLARARRGLLPHHGLGGRPADPDRLRARTRSPSTPRWRSPNGCRSPTATAACASAACVRWGCARA